MLQDIIAVPGDEVGGWQPEITSLERTGDRSLKSQPETSLPESSMGKRKSPMYEIVNMTTEEGRKAHATFMMKNLLWILIRIHSSQSK